VKVVFLGVGEACDERLPNTSIWIQTFVDGQKKSILLDCGFTVPALYWQRAADQEELDVLWISHFHGDHFFGVPALLLRFWELKRRKPLVLMGQAGIEDIVNRAMDLAYPNFMRKLTYPLEFITVEPGKNVSAIGLTWGFAENVHSQRDLAVRIEDGANSIFYSGDGAPTDETLYLAEHCDLVIHEAFRLDQVTAGHGTIKNVVDFAGKAGASIVALVHVQRDERRDRCMEILNVIGQTVDLKVLLPEPGYTIDL